MENLQPKDSLAIIQEIINHRKQKYEANGVIFIVWGVLVAISSLVHYFTESPKIWEILMPIGSVVTFIHYFIKGKNARKKGISLDWGNWIWAVAGLCAMYFGFILIQDLGEITYPFISVLIYMPFVFSALASALQLKNRLWIFTSILSIIVLLASIQIAFLDFWKLNFLVPGVVATLILTIPGIQLFKDYKRRVK